MGEEDRPFSSIFELIREDDFCSFASLLAENESLIKDSDDYGRTVLWVSNFFMRFLGDIMT